MNSGPATPYYSHGGTPPLPSLLRGNTNESVIQSLSSSPEQLHHHNHPARRSMGIGNIAGGFARALNASSTFGIMNMSPPTKRRNVSPAGSFNAPSASAPGNILTWGPPTIHNYKASAESALSDSSFDENEGDDAGNHHNTSNVDIQIFNFEQFEEESSLVLPLLDPTKAKLYNCYRENYADMLYLWDEKVARLEILKFNGFSNERDEVQTPFSKKKNDVWKGLGQYSDLILYTLFAFDIFSSPAIFQCRLPSRIYKR